jgi:DNA-directed RNA polymerase subunit E'/Rpb7
MEPIVTKKNENKKRNIRTISSIYSRCLISKNIILPINTIGKNIKETLEKYISANFEGKCLVEGFIKPQSTKIVSYSSGLVYRGNNISFEVVFECYVCFPVEGMLISCVAKKITKAGITAESAVEVPSPVMVHVARDHSYNNSLFSDVKIGDKIDVRVIGQRFELNDKYVSIIGELVKPKTDMIFNKKQPALTTTKPKIIIEE